jgi:tetratricopeptide (TPR) repeat protein
VHLAVLGAVSGGLASSAHEWLLQRLGAVIAQRDISKAIKYHAQCLAIAKEMGDRAGEGRGYGNLGCAYQSQGDFSQAIEYHTQCLAIAKEVGDRAGEGGAYGNIGIAYESQGDSSKASKYHAQDIAKEVGDRAGEGQAYANLGTSHMHLNEATCT